MINGLNEELPLDTLYPPLESIPQPWHAGGVDANDIIDFNAMINGVLTSASVTGDIDVAQAAMNLGADVNAQSITGDIPLNIAIENDKTQIVELLLNSNRVDLNNFDRLGNT
ncbi:MAG: ankyrin repeat domain-containing protein, partial [Anaerolineales bacterium]|nr:ankyrin repeat domain-containing protein [Anaerolineales bacterium]